MRKSDDEEEEEEAVEAVEDVYCAKRQLLDHLLTVLASRIFLRNQLAVTFSSSVMQSF